MNEWMLLVPCCGDCYDFRVKTIFDSSWLICFVQARFLIRLYSCRLTVARRVSHVEQKLLTLSGHLSSLPVFSGVRVARSLVLCIVCCITFVVLFLLSVGHCTVCPSSVYDFWLPPFGIFQIFLFDIMFDGKMIISEEYWPGFRTNEALC